MIISRDDEKNAPRWTADRRIYLDATGKVVEEGNPDRQSLLIAPGQTMALADAQMYGLVDADGHTIAPGGAADEAVETESESKATAPPLNKAKVPRFNKALTDVPGEMPGE